MKIKIRMKDNVRQIQNINPKNLEKYKKKYPDLEIVEGIALTFLVGLIVFISGCNVYTPSEINIDNQAPERIEVGISEDNTQINISIMEKPRELVKYEFKGSLIQILCYNDSSPFNHSILWSYGIEKVTKGNSVYTYPKIQATPLQDITHINKSRDFCFIRGNNLELIRLDYVDGILISNETEWLNLYNIFGNRDFDIDCRNYISDECVFNAPDKLKEFIKKPRTGVFHIFEYMKKNLQ